MTSLTERELSRTQFKSMVVMVWHVVEEVCKDEAVQISGVKKYDTMFCCIKCFFSQNLQKKVLRYLSTYAEVLPGLPGLHINQSTFWKGRPGKKGRPALYLVKQPYRPPQPARWCRHELNRTTANFHFFTITLSHFFRSISLFRHLLL